MSEAGASDLIRLVGLRVRGHHGVFQFERTEGQDFVIDAELEVDLRPAALSDNLADTVDYGVLATRLAVIVGGPPLNLIETLVEKLAIACLEDERVKAATVTVHKPSAPVPVEFSDVSVTVRRTRGDLAKVSS